MARRGGTSSTEIEFSIVPWNNSALDEGGGQRAVAQESFGGAFVFDVVFKSNHTGFVVQNIRKYKSYSKKAPRRPMARGEYDWGVNYEDCNNCAGPCSYSCYKLAGTNTWEKTGDEECMTLPVPEQKSADCTIDDYWEIFYIGKNGKSWNTDRFSQTFLEDESEGTIIQIGYAYFFPYDKSVSQENEVVKLTPSIKNIFGSHVGGEYNIEMANDLPSSKTQPLMRNLEPVKNVIVHKLTVKWGKHEPKSKFQRKNAWSTEVTEEAFEGAQLYKEFPWEYKEERPFYFTSTEWDAVDLKRRKTFQKPKYKCPQCDKVHYKENWWDYHDNKPDDTLFDVDTNLPKNFSGSARGRPRKKRGDRGGAGDESGEEKGVVDPSGKRVIAVYPGRFQPMGKHHKETYEWMAAKFGADNSFIVTSDKVELPDSPFGFEDKKIIAQAMGIPDHAIRREKIVYAPRTFSFMKERDPGDTAVVVVVGEKDMKASFDPKKNKTVPPRFVKYKNLDGLTKSGKPTYYQSYDSQTPLEGFDKHGYILTAPHQGFDVDGEEMSGSRLRAFIPTASDEKIEALMGISDQEAIDLLREKL